MIHDTYTTEPSAFCDLSILWHEHRQRAKGKVCDRPRARACSTGRDGQGGGRQSHHRHGEAITWSWKSSHHEQCLPCPSLIRFDAAWSSAVSPPPFPAREQSNIPILLMDACTGSGQETKNVFVVVCLLLLMLRRQHSASGNGLLTQGTV